MKPTPITFLSSDWRFYLSHPWELFSDLYKEIKSFIQRGRYGYAQSDVWNFNDYLERVLAGGLRQLSDSHSFPGRGKMDTYKKWQDALRKNAKRLEDAIRYLETDWENDVGYKEGKRVTAERDKALKFIVKWFDSLWD